MTTELEAALTVLRERVEHTVSSMPPSAAERRNPENGVVVPMGALDTVIAALSFPPADDVREALAKILTGLDDREWAIATADGHRHLDGYFEAADRILDVFEVRLRGTVTEPCEWCDEQHTGFAERQGDGLAHPSCGRDGHGTNFEPARGTITDAERAAINGALIEVLPIWTSEIETEYARSALLRAIVPALEAARGARVSAENITPTNHENRSL